jgi:PhzF family phenazine biosynthesis protein
MNIPIYQVDAFTDRPFAGNPAAVCLLPEPRDDDWMQHVAQEMNLSETAFVLARMDGYDLRWFTPAVEVDLCGHATLASAHILWEQGLLEGRDPARFHTRSGLLTAERRGREIVLDFPATPEEPAEPPEDLLDALGVEATYTGKSKFDYLIEVPSEAVLRRLEPDFPRIKQLPVRGVMVTSRSDAAGVDFVSRFFAPAAGINEDPVTGSAHCCLGPFWQHRLGKDALVAVQASARGGTLQVRIAGDRVLIGGPAVTVWRGELIDPAGVGQKPL